METNNISLKAFWKSEHCLYDCQNVSNCINDSTSDNLDDFDDNFEDFCMVMLTTI